MTMDIRCVVCGEPWDAYGVRNGDMAPWEAALFRQGAGCPSCEGCEPETPFEPSAFTDIENGDEDPLIRLQLVEARASRPKWARPEPKPLYACEACGVRVSEDKSESPDPDDDTWDLVIVDVRPNHYASRDYVLRRDHTADEIRTGVDVCGHRVCPCCVEICSECGCTLCDAVSDDTYSGCASFPDPRDEYHQRVCVDCLSLAETESAEEGWRNASLRERIAACKRAGVSIFAAKYEYIPHDDDGSIQERFR